VAKVLNTSLANIFLLFTGKQQTNSAAPSGAYYVQSKNDLLLDKY